MKAQATVVLTFQAKTLAEAGAGLDDVLGRARERDDVDGGRASRPRPGLQGHAPWHAPYARRNQRRIGDSHMPSGGAGANSCAPTTSRSRSFSASSVPGVAV